MNITRRWCDLEFYLDATSVPIPCEDAKAREVSKTAASAPSRESRYEGGRRLEQTAGAGGRGSGLRRRGQETRFSISHFSFFIFHLGHTQAERGSSEWEYRDTGESPNEK